MAEMAIRTAHHMARVAAAAGVLTLAIFATTCAWAQEQTSSPPERAAQVAADPAPVRPIRVSGSATQATLLSQVAPVYPPIAKTAHISGTVLLHCLIGKDGSVETLEYVSGPPLLMKAALDAVRQWKYKPMLLNGQPVRVDTTVSVVFMLDAAPAAAASQQSKSDPTEWYKPRGYVNDFAGMIDSPVQAQLEQVCKDLDQKTQTRMAIVTVESLEGLSAKDFATQLCQPLGRRAQRHQSWRATSALRYRSAISHLCEPGPGTADFRRRGGSSGQGNVAHTPPGRLRRRAAASGQSDSGRTAAKNKMKSSMRLRESLPVCRAH